MIKKVLIANRGEIVSRIIRTLNSMGIKSVAVYDEAEKNAKYVAEADESFSLGNGPLNSTFLDGSKILQIATQASVDAIHPGYGFLSENAEFAEKILRAGITFIGPSPHTLRIMGDKHKAILLAGKIGIPVIPSFSGSVKNLSAELSGENFPVLVKASIGGGGKAMHIANSEVELIEMMKTTAAESEKYYGIGPVYVEKLIKPARHIEVQLLGDQRGNIVHLYERECSIQRRYQKIIEEAPTVFLSANQRNAIISDALKIAKEADYYSAGTVEFLFDENGNHYFLEMNARIQVEHPVTEMITGIDIVREQLNIASGNPLPDYLYTIKPEGHAIEVRIYAEDPEQNFRPSPGKITLVDFPEKRNLRIEYSIKANDILGDSYDPMLAKMIAWGTTRDEALSLLRSALRVTAIQGVNHNICFLQNILCNDDFVKGKINTDFINLKLHALKPVRTINDGERVHLALAGLYLSLITFPQSETGVAHSGYWRIHKNVDCQLGNTKYKFLIENCGKEKLAVYYNEKRYDLTCRTLSGTIMQFSDTNGEMKSVHYSWLGKDPVLLISSDCEVHPFSRNDFLRKTTANKKSAGERAGYNSTTLRSPLTGRVLKINYKVNELIEEGDILIVIESMKTENEIRNHSKGKIKSIHVKVGDQVSEGDVLVEFGTGKD